ncbi:hypothetical protein H8959_016273 [Pygathrix nigripes]
MGRWHRPPWRGIALALPPSSGFHCGPSPGLEAQPPPPPAMAVPGAPVILKSPVPSVPTDFCLKASCSLSLCHATCPRPTDNLEAHSIGLAGAAGPCTLDEPASV